jgi:hypothetical protein
MTHVLIATPTAGGTVKAAFATTLAKTMKALHAEGFDVDFMTIDSAYISKARNCFVQQLLSRNMTHLVMIDSDMAVEGHTITRLIRCEKPVVAAVYSQRNMDLEKFLRAARGSELQLEELSALAMEFNVQPKVEEGTRQVRVVDGMCRVGRVALGCSAIRRDAFLTMIEAGAVQHRPDAYLARNGFEGPVYDFFSEITVDDGDVLSEDYSFCMRWLGLPNAEIWAIIDEPIGHVGQMVYAAPYVKRLLQGKA